MFHHDKMYVRTKHIDFSAICHKDRKSYVLLANSRKFHAQNEELRIRELEKENQTLIL